MSRSSRLLDQGRVPHTAEMRVLSAKRKAEIQAKGWKMAKQSICGAEDEEREIWMDNR